jgi:hypothetical protein
MLHLLKFHDQCHRQQTLHKKLIHAKLGDLITPLSSLPLYTLLFIVPVGTSYITASYFFTFRTGRPQTTAESLCRFRLGVRIGRQVGQIQNNWFLVPSNPYHNGHGREETCSLRKPKRLRSPFELQLAQDVMESYGGSGVASSLYYHRTGDVVDRRLLQQLTSITRQAAGLHTGSPAQSLLDDLRCLLVIT